MRYAFMPEGHTLKKVAVAQAHDRETDNAAIPEAIDETPLRKGVFRKVIPRVRELIRGEKFKLREKYRWKFKGNRAFLITMRFSNGTRRTWLIVSKKEFFKYRKRMYHLYYENAWYDLTHQTYHLDYFDDYTEPIDRKIMLKSDEDAPAGKETSFFSVTPSNIKPIIKMEYVKALAESQSINKYLKMIMLFIGFNLLLNVWLVYSTYKLGKLIPLIQNVVLKIAGG